MEPDYTLYRCNDCGHWHESAEECMACECIPDYDGDPELPVVQDGGETGGFPEYPW